jgi:ubiquinone biosynthesis protein COQ9
MTEPKHADDALKQAVLAAALRHAPEHGFTDRLMTRAGTEAGIGCETMLQLFPGGLAGLVAFYSEQNDAEMERLLAREKLPQMKVRDRIAAAVLTRLEILKPHKQAARRAAAFLLLPVNAALGAKLLYQTVDVMWRAAGDASTDINFYTKRGILAGVYSATLMRWFNDDSEDGQATRAFLSARIENVMQFEKLKAEFRERTKDLPSLSDIVKNFSERRI